MILCTCKLEHVATSTLSLVFDLSALGQKDGDPGGQTVLMQIFTWVFEVKHPSKKCVPGHLKLQGLN